MPPERMFNNFSYSAFAAACLSCSVVVAAGISRPRGPGCLPEEPFSVRSWGGDPGISGDGPFVWWEPEDLGRSISIVSLVEAIRVMPRYQTAQTFRRQDPLRDAAADTLSDNKGSSRSSQATPRLFTEDFRHLNESKC